MSLNLGTSAIEATRNLANNGDFRVLHDALLERADAMIHGAMEMKGGSDRDDAIGYARALRDVWVALQSAATGTQYRATKRPSLNAPIPTAPAGRN